MKTKQIIGKACLAGRDELKELAAAKRTLNQQRNANGISAIQARRPLVLVPKNPRHLDQSKANNEQRKKGLIVNIIKHLWIAPFAGLLALTACSTNPEIRNRPGFLSTYNHIQKVDDTTSRYISPVLLGQCDKFIVSPVKILFNEAGGKTITPEQRQKSADFIRQSVVSALSDRYPIVTESGPGVAEIRIALTDAYRTGGKLGLSVEGEILDNSNTQVAAVMRTELSELYVANWENRPAAKEMVDAWAKRLRQAIDQAHANR